MPARHRFSASAAARPYAVTYSTPLGSRRVVLFRSLRPALAFREILSVNAPGSTPRLLPPSRMTIEDLLEAWLRSRRGELPPESLRRYRRLFTQTVLFAAGATRLADLRYFGPEEWDDALAGPRQVRSLVRAAMRWGEERGIVRMDGGELEQQKWVI